MAHMNGMHYQSSSKPVNLSNYSRNLLKVIYIVKTQCHLYEPFLYHRAQNCNTPFSIMLTSSLEQWTLLIRDHNGKKFALLLSHPAFYANRIISNHLIGVHMYVGITSSNITHHGITPHGILYLSYTCDVLCCMYNWILSCFIHQNGHISLNRWSSHDVPHIIREDLLRRVGTISCQAHAEECQMIWETRMQTEILFHITRRYGGEDHFIRLSQKCKSNSFSRP